YFLYFGLPAVSLLLAGVACGCLLAGRPKQAAKSFAPVPLIWAVSVPLFGTVFGERFNKNPPLPTLLFVLILLLAGAGQFIAAFRGPRTYAVALGCAVVSIALLVKSVLFGSFPENSTVALSLPLAVASLTIALLLDLGPRPAGVDRIKRVWR